jgi:hypothetical protein
VRNFGGSTDRLTRGTHRLRRVYVDDVRAHHGRVIASFTIASVVAAALGLGAQAEPAELAKPPRGVVVDCARQSGSGGAPGGTFRSTNNLVVGPIAMRGAGLRPVGFSPDLGWQKVPVFMKAGHRVTVELPRDAWPGAGLVYGPRPKSPRLARTGYRVVTFVPCRRDELPPPNPHSFVACCFSFWPGGVRADAPQCVRLLFWVDDARSPRRGVIHLGVPDCE